jgi:hypothetical protein
MWCVNTRRLPLSLNSDRVRGIPPLTSPDHRASSSPILARWAGFSAWADHRAGLLKVVTPPRIKRLMAEDEPKREMLEAMMRYVLGRARQELNIQ